MRLVAYVDKFSLGFDIECPLRVALGHERYLSFGGHYEGYFSVREAATAKSYLRSSPAYRQAIWREARKDDRRAVSQA